ncbi:MAG TPA: GlsB/YeaQ/YmgE family stress response membrane protein [Actinomycetaceae bacterium]|nr:GlsB/YeaQ/YmgE family stress response membrane protein [Actinomycetaceae bacterium]
MHWIMWLIVGGLAGWLASVIMKSDNSFGIIGDIVIGIIGGMLGGFLLSLVGLQGTGSWIGTFVTALLGAVVLIWLLHRFTGRGNRVAGRDRR